MKKVHVTSYNPQWPEHYNQEAALIKKALGEESLLIEHVGSTAIPGLAAKPRIDIIAGIRPHESLEYLKQRQAELSIQAQHFLDQQQKKYRSDASCIGKYI